MQIVQDYKQPPARIASPEPPEGFGDLMDTLAAAEDSVQAIGMDIVESQKLFGAWQAAIGGPDALRSFLPRPSPAAEGFQFQRSPFVEANYGAVGRTAPIESPDAVFFGQSPGRWTFSRCGRAAH